MNDSQIAPRVASAVGAMLGEGPIWDPRDGCLWFVDIKHRHVHRLRPGETATTRWNAPGQIGWVLPADDGAFLAGLQAGIHRFDPADGSFVALVDPEPDLPDNRLNDATVGPDGAIWFGTMDDECRVPSGRVYRYDGGRIVPTALPPVAITNGPAVSPDGRTLYPVDTVGGIVHAVPIGADGTLGTPRVFVTIDPRDGTPDGASIDSAGNVWLGLWGGAQARCHAPDGTLVRTVRFPTDNITKVAFGGADLRTAYATSARAGLTPEQLAAQPDAGHVFAFRVTVPGLPSRVARIR